jgi:anion-transporting  ArsA/GET3 family ATPase
LAELGEDSYLGRVLLSPPRGDVPHQPLVLADGLWLSQWSGESCLREYVLHYLRIERLYRLFFENRVMRALVNVAPGLPEVAIVGKATSGPRKVGPAMPYQNVVIDSFATGHSLALWRAPRGMGQAIAFGPMGQHSRQMDEVMRNPVLNRIVIVTLAEELPVQETIELAVSLKELGLPRPVVVVNRLWDESLLDSVQGQSSELAQLIQHQLKRQSEQVAALKEGLGKDIMVVRAPQVWKAAAGPVIETLAAESWLNELLQNLNLEVS